MPNKDRRFIRALVQEEGPKSLKALVKLRDGAKDARLQFDAAIAIAKITSL